MKSVFLRWPYFRHIGSCIVENDEENNSLGFFMELYWERFNVAIVLMINIYCLPNNQLVRFLREIYQIHTMGINNLWLMYQFFKTDRPQSSYYSCSPLLRSLPPKTPHVIRPDFKCPSWEATLHYRRVDLIRGGLLYWFCKH